jgi:hypothetical protein
MTTKPFKGRKGFDSNNERIQNVGNAKEDSDAVVLSQMKEYVDSIFSNVDKRKETMAVNSNSTLVAGIVLCTNTESVTHSLVEGDEFIITNTLAKSDVSLTSRLGIINPFLDNSEIVGKNWDKLDIPNHAYTVNSAQGHLLYSRQDQVLYGLGASSLNPVLTENIQDFAVNSSGNILVYVQNNKLYKTDIQRDQPDYILLNECSLVDVIGNSIATLNNQREIHYSNNSGDSFKKMNKLIPATKLIATHLEPCIYVGKQIQYGGKVATVKGTVKCPVATSRGVIFVSDEQTKGSIYLLDQNGMSLVKEYTGYFQSFDANYDLTKLALLTRGSLSVSSKLGFWNDYKTDMVAENLSLTNDGESLLAVGSGSVWISKFDANNVNTKLNGFTMKPKSTIHVVKSLDYACYVVVDETCELAPEVEKVLTVTDVWVSDGESQVIFPEKDINAHLPAEPKDNFKFSVSVILCEYSGTVTLKGSGLTLNNVEYANIPTFKHEVDGIFKSYDDETWELVEDYDYDEFVRVEEFTLSHGETYKFIYIKSKGGWYVY